jgi:hypothetical protein
LGVDSTDKMAELTDALSVAARRALRLPVLLPTILLHIASALLGVGVAGRLVPVVRDGRLSDVAAWGEQYRGSMALMGLLVLVCAPAVASGLASMAGAVAETEDRINGWGPLLQGLGRYYWRIVGACAALVAAVMVGIILLGVFVGPVSIAPDSRDLVQSILVVFGTMGAYFFGPWIAVVVVDDAGVMTAATRSVKFAWKNPHVLAPAYVIQAVLHSIADKITDLGSAEAYYQSTGALPPGWFIGALVGAALSGAIYIYFLVFRIYAYRRSVITPPEPVPSDEDEVAEDEDDHGEDDQGVPPVTL